MSELFKRIWGKFNFDEKVLEVTRRIGPTFPLPGPHYDYADFIEHMRHSAYFMNICEVRKELFSYHLFEVYRRRNRLIKALTEARDAGLITGREHEHAMRHIDQLSKDWEEEMVEAFDKCVCKDRKREPPKLAGHSVVL